jgi:hypothetical protein
MENTKAFIPDFLQNPMVIFILAMRPAFASILD